MSANYESAKQDLNPVKRYRVLRGHVDCPARGRIDVEVCFYCPLLESIDMDSPVKSIHCRPFEPESDAERLAYERLGILQLADTLGNVSEACRERGISRRVFYLYKHAFEEHGLEGLMFRSRRGRRQYHK
ncbi:helix-turn-helix domain-containing protein [Alicyclobacillus ferrooxydans]|uniref:helix-turn-helix domain-containing protein n=1 Tax=Alicyclobacillus ferrooxydans TaxID=471514 RepID=UPI0006D5788F|nr:helix-turn-helix domain-containing protein [Alicyclobacillus ferrooxydans]